MIVRDVMNRNVVTAKSQITLKEASKVMSQLKIGSLIVTEEEKIVGILTSSDVLKAIAESKDPDETVAEEVMSKNVITIDPDKTIDESVELMAKNKIKKLPVVDSGKLTGIITASDLLVVEPKLIENIAQLVSLKLPGYRGG